MSTDIFSVSEKDSIDVALTMLSWQPIHHLPVENKHGEVIGILTDGLLERHRQHDNQFVLIEDIMIKDVVTVAANDSIAHVQKIMQEHQLSGIPVTYERKLVGILTKSDLKKAGIRENS